MALLAAPRKSPVPPYERSLPSMEGINLDVSPELIIEEVAPSPVPCPDVPAPQPEPPQPASAPIVRSEIAKMVSRDVARVMQGRGRFAKASTLPCSSSEDDDSMGPKDHILRNASSNSLPASSPTLYETTKLALETDPGIHREIALGKLVGFYKLGKELGCGNFSKVKLGVHTLTREKVAVKVMDKSKMDLKASRLFAREVASMEHLHHPNVIRLFEVIETLSKVFLVMEYAGGGELYTYVHENGKLIEDAAKPIFAQLISAVGHLHAKGIVHRDIKAENVIFAQPGWVKLADFGFSCRYTEDPLNTFCGSPPYAAPELFRDAEYNGPMVDMWALGVTLYFMLVGVTPFRGDTISMLKTNIMSNNYAMPEYLSGFAQFVIQRLLCQDPTKRAAAADIRKMYWLSQSKFPESYLQISVTPNESNLATDETERRVWAKLGEIGITAAMIRESVGKGARDSIIGTYRIVLFQAQAPDHDKEVLKVRNHAHRMNAQNKRAEEQFNQRSKTCIII
uniref:non-specific serine/threonine protein kinase n=1 Tax=Panagrellus redivivus TaxID=6233 RepID=A0A7E4UUP3_PANRE